mmetsp:Transcript_30066/g.63757  ORF Transcript_30066/g.63757 Transcript_30066/m.63757 type:complete len:126 (+) Transcript_30066:771-1148(+)
MANEAHSYFAGVRRHGENNFIIVKANSGGANNNSSYDDENNNNGESIRKVVCYGDKVTLRSGTMKRVLGVQKKEQIVESSHSNDQGGANGGNDDTTRNVMYKLEVGWYRCEGRFSTGNTWTVPRG